MPSVYVDACVLRLAFLAEEDDVSELAIQELDRGDAEFLYSSIVELELIPMPTKNKREKELQFFRTFFEAAHRVPCLDDVQMQALELGGIHGLGACDALHISCAIAAGADEFVTAEGFTKGLGQLNEKVIGNTTFRTVRLP